MELAAVLGAQGTPDRQRIFIPEAADQVKRLAGKVDFVITGRMHVAIAALGMGTPAICLTFQGKFAGLLEYFSLEKYLIDPGSFEAGMLRRTCIDMLANLEELSARVKASLPKVIDLARSNFHHLIGRPFKPRRCHASTSSPPPPDRAGAARQAAPQTHKHVLAMNGPASR
jgi:polysaccharide pyruvyl transferase WcaK-like protein